mmetsp:Transcript_65569/g.182285  ORF Transcript_65569/g.182285 Transcript_65569/m.182285 type:complete len:217 (-) Transcript_65569:687-1337(-)
MIPTLLCREAEQPIHVRGLHAVQRCKEQRDTAEIGVALKVVGCLLPHLMQAAAALCGAPARFSQGGDQAVKRAEGELSPSAFEHAGEAVELILRQVLLLLRHLHTPSLRRLQSFLGLAGELRIHGNDFFLSGRDDVCVRTDGLCGLDALEQRRCAAGGGLLQMVLHDRVQLLFISPGILERLQLRFALLCLQQTDSGWFKRLLVQTSGDPLLNARS